MEKAKVYYTDFRTKLGEGLPTKLKRLIRAAGIGEIDMDNKFVAIKMHFGELGNLGFLRPNYAKAVADVVKELGGKPAGNAAEGKAPVAKKEAAETAAGQVAMADAETPVQSDKQKSKRKFFGRKE